MANLTTLPFDYQHAGLDFDGVLVSGEHPNAPTVLVFHGMEGRSDAQVDFCHRLAEVGYKAVAVDLFGRAVTAHGSREIDATDITSRTSLHWRRSRGEGGGGPTTQAFEAVRRSRASMTVGQTSIS